MSFKRRLINTCSILKPVVTTTNEWKTKKVEYVAPISPVNLQQVPCFYYPATGMEAVDPQRKVSIDAGFFDFLPDVPITHDDRIKFNNIVYEIIQVGPVGGGHHIKAKAQRLLI